MRKAKSGHNLAILDRQFESSKELLQSAIPYLPLASPQEHVIPVLIHSESRHNPLMAAAATLIAYLSKLRETKDHDNVLELREELVEQIRSFEVRAQQSNIFSDTILIARYSLCAALDETIMQTAWGQAAQWQKQTLLEYFQGEIWGGERFFLILERLKANPKQHIDLLEVMYIVLSLGFEGQYQRISRNDYTLDRIIDELFQIIRHYRGDFKKELVDEDNLDQLTAEIYAMKHAQASIHHPVWLVMLLMVTAVFTIYAGFSYMLSSSIHPLYKTTMSMVQSSANINFNTAVGARYEQLL